MNQQKKLAKFAAINFVLNAWVFILVWLKKCRILRIGHQCNVIASALNDLQRAVKLDS